ncbi:hypothetical protein FDN13_05685 [Caloramator sp. E03]|uniref:hypothetical protein n=1 Tax=Caloramator sp. E03 TaxID=2576307 RepID=UPI0011104003|nr:hypothetical protein [Caloramator sp. E03]QCX33233.1 hypothetical protein FDN13_05685 [Caloramator sp. E03]
MDSLAKMKKRMLTFSLLGIILFLNLFLLDSLIIKVESLKQEYETLSKKIENSNSNISHISEKDIEKLFNGNEVKNAN